MDSRTGVPVRHGAPLAWKLSMLPAVLSALLLTGCGGGGGGNGGGNTSDQSMALSPTVVSVSASTVDPAPAGGSSVSIVNSLPGYTYYVFASTTNSGIVSVGVSNVSSSFSASGQVTINFKTPSTLGPGTYSDTVTVTACYDQGCSQQLGNSPQKVSVQYTVTPPKPTLVSLNPSSVSAGSAAFNLTVYGTEFSPGAVVNWNGVALATTVVSTTQLTAAVPAADVAAGGSIPVTVTDPGIAPTSPMTFTVNPTLVSSVQPDYIAAGGPSFTLNVYGSGFASSSVVEWNGSGRATTYVSPTQVQAQILPSDIAAAGTASINVLTPSGTAGISASVPVTIAVPPTWPASADAAAVQMNPSHTGAVTFSTVTFPTTSSWSVDLGSTVTYTLIAAGKVFVTTTSSGATSLYALDRTTGGTIWGPIAIPGLAGAAYDNGMVFVSSGAPPSGSTSGGSVQAYSATTGALLWTTPMAGFNESTTSPPTATGGYVYVTGGSAIPIDDGTYALAESNGTVSWFKENPEAGNSPPAVTANGVYVDFSCDVTAYNPTTGTQLWSFPSCGSGAPTGSTASVVGNTVFAPSPAFSYSGVTLNVATGASIGTYKSVVPPVFDSQNGYFVQEGQSAGSAGSLQAIGLSSNTVSWTFTGNGATCASIVVSQYVIAEECDGTLYGLDAATGQQEWLMSASAAPGVWNLTGQPPFTGPVAGDGVLVIPLGTKLVTYTLATSP